jgi:DHA1 family bicyclomycin/chloramphenicol resistance-like MFS transporter
MTREQPSRLPKEFIVFTASSMVLTALGIDIMLPAFADLRAHFAHTTDPTETSKLISWFFMGQVTQLAFGYLTDRHGRLPVLRAGMLLYITSGLLTVFVPNLQWMIIFRFISGMGAAAVFMTSIASVRDRYSGDAMARITSFVVFIFLFTPVAAPFLGAWLMKFYSWKIVFLVPPCFAVLVFIWSFRMRESHPKEKRPKAGFTETLTRLRSIVTNKGFMRYAVIATLLFTPFSSYISSSERIIGEIYAEPALFPYIFGGIGLIMACFAFSNSYFSGKFGAKPTLRTLLLIYSLAALLFFISSITIGDPPPLIIFFISMTCICSITTMADPNSTALALQHMGDKAGLATSIYGTMFFFIGSVAGAFISSKLIHGIVLLAAGFAIAGITASILALTEREPRQ